jgi:hypothetical protein
MEAKNILTALFILLFVTSGVAKADIPVVRFTLTLSGKTIELYTPSEKEFDENHFSDLFKSIISSQRKQASREMIDISAFIIPEEEIDESGPDFEPLQMK